MDILPHVVCIVLKYLHMILFVLQMQSLSTTLFGGLLVIPANDYSRLPPDN